MVIFYGVIFFLINYTYLIYLTSDLSNSDRILQYLEAHGYMKTLHKDLLKEINGSQIKDPLKIALKNFQIVNKLNVTGEIDNSTNDLVSKKRCGHSDSSLIMAEFLIELKWKKSNLKWAFMNYLSDLKVETEIIQKAFEKWTQHIPLAIKSKPLGDEKVDFKIGYGPALHENLKCTKEFKSSELAHAFFPPSFNSNQDSYGVEGDIHFNNKILWQFNENLKGYKLFSVAIHEIGHSLGLEHSSSTSSIMYPYINIDNNLTELFGEDVLRIQSLYGKKYDDTVATINDGIRVDYDSICYETINEYIIGTFYDKFIISFNRIVQLNDLNSPIHNWVPIERLFRSSKKVDAHWRDISGNIFISDGESIRKYYNRELMETFRFQDFFSKDVNNVVAILRVWDERAYFIFKSSVWYIQIEKNDDLYGPFSISHFNLRSIDYGFFDYKIQKFVISSANNRYDGRVDGVKLCWKAEKRKNSSSYHSNVCSWNCYIYYGDFLFYKKKNYNIIA